jgi:dCTP diphosphatase
METTQIETIQKQIADFATEREWDQFHTPKNLAMALTVEASELMEIFQWKTSDESKAILKDELRSEQVEEEIADILIYALRFANVLNIDVDEAIQKKIVKNAKKYPVEKAKGNSLKYNQLS